MTKQRASLDLGIAWMDHEHHQLANLLDEFAHCVREGEQPERASYLIDQAIRHANAHFEHEESVAAEANYPDIEEERFNHRNMRLQFTTLAADTAGAKYCDPITLDHLDTMRILLEEHINGPDRELAEYLKAAHFDQAA